MAKIVEALSGGIGRSSREAGFCEELRVHRGAEEEKERVPDGGESWGSEEDMERLEALLRAHDETVAGQSARPDVLEMMRTFAPLLAAVRNTEEFRALMDRSEKNLGDCLCKNNAEGAKLPEDRRRIEGDLEVLKVESQRLTELPVWAGQVGAHFDRRDDYRTMVLEIPASIGKLGALRELRLQGLMSIQELPEGEKRLACVA